MNYIYITTQFIYITNLSLLHVKHRKREPEGVHGQLEGCNRNLRPKAAVAKVFHRKGIVTVLNIPGKNIEWIYIFDIANI